MAISATDSSQEKPSSARADEGTVVILNWTSASLQLVRTLVRELSRQAMSEGQIGGRAPWALGVGPSLGESEDAFLQGAGLDRSEFRFEVGCLDLSQDMPAARVRPLQKTLRRIGVWDARAVVILPLRTEPEPDSHSNRTYQCLRGVLKDRRQRALQEFKQRALVAEMPGRPDPPVFIELLDREAHAEVDDGKLQYLFHENEVRARLLAQASIDLGAYGLFDSLLRGRQRVSVCALPSGLLARASTFGEVVDIVHDGDFPDFERMGPITVLGLQDLTIPDAARRGGGWINPPRSTPLSDRSRLVLLCEQPLHDLAPRVYRGKSSNPDHLDDE